MQAVLRSLDRLQSFRYQFISTSRNSASCRSLSWVCPEGLRLLSFPFSVFAEAFLGDLSLLPTESPDCFFNLGVFPSEPSFPTGRDGTDSILEVPVCLSEKTLSHCNESNLN